jgi:hypothetical protein
MKSHPKIRTGLFAIAAIVGSIFLGETAAKAQVPADMAAQLRAIGNGVCVPETAKSTNRCKRRRHIRESR